MIGIRLVAHGRGLAEGAPWRTAEVVVGPPLRRRSATSKRRGRANRKCVTKIEEADPASTRGGGAVAASHPPCFGGIGGRPSSCLSFINERKGRGGDGVNLPWLLKLVSAADFAGKPISRAGSGPREVAGGAKGRSGPCAESCGGDGVKDARGVPSPGRQPGSWARQGARGVVPALGTRTRGVLVGGRGRRRPQTAGALGDVAFAISRQGQFSGAQGCPAAAESAAGRREKGRDRRFATLLLVRGRP